MATCRKCGAELDADGTCAICMLAGAFGPELAADPAIEEQAGDGLEYDSFGPYRILRLLGEGGMGAVYLAEQTRPLMRQVALKVVKLGLSSRQILSRFNYERQTLAAMDHPNIAHIFDAGASEKGRPFFVMEYVDGVPVTQYCDRNRLTIKERLELFITVCQALQHAHRKGVIHRDIKPSNVMVAEVDGHPVPKIIDFGIARATEPDLSGQATLTHVGQFIGTPEYMSPEQADLVTGDIDTTSDVYSLGVLLYELLTGAVPFGSDALRKVGFAELLRIIREEEATPMTAKLSGSGEATRKAAERRRTDSATLLRLVSGDLNWIVQRAMEKDRKRRYPAASDLAADIRRYLDDQPVLASPPSFAYRAGKFARRYKGRVAAAAAIVAALIGGLITTTWQAAIARRERADAVVARTVAGAHLNDVHTLAYSMLFEINDDVKDLAGGTKARAALIRLGQQYLSKQAADMGASATNRRELAEALLRVGDLQGAPDASNLRDVSGARASYARSVSILEREVGLQPRDAKVRHLLTVAYVRQVQLEESTLAAKTFGSVIHTFWTFPAELNELPPEANASLDRAEKSVEKFVLEWPTDLQGLRDRADVLQAKGEFAQAVTLRQRILATNAKDPLLRWELGHAQLALGTSLVLKNRRQALSCLSTAAAACERLSKEDPANVRYQRDRAVALGTMTRVLLNMGRLPQALASAQESVTILEQLTAADPNNASFHLDLSAGRVALSNAYYNNGKTAQALENVALAAAVQEREAALHPDNPDFPRQAAFQYRNTGRFKTYSRDFQGALEQFRKAEAIDRKLVGRYPGQFEFFEGLREDLDAIGGVLLTLGDRTSAAGAYRNALTAARPGGTALSAESLTGLALAHQSLASCLGAMEQWDQAIEEQRSAVAIWDRKRAARGGDQGIERARSRAYEELARMYEGRGDFKNAAVAAQTALSYLEADYAKHAEDESARTEVRNALASVRVESGLAGDHERAIVAAKQIVELMKKTGVVSRSTVTRDLGEALLAAGRRDESLAALRQAAAILDQSKRDGKTYPFEKEPSPYFRHELGSTLLTITVDFTKARREEEGVALLKRLQPVLEGLVRENETQPLYRDTLVSMYRATATAYLRMGDAARSLEFEHKAFRLEPKLEASSRDAYERWLRRARVGFLQLRLGKRDTAQREWRKALAGFEAVIRASGKRWSADQQDRSELETMKLAKIGAAFVREALGDQDDQRAGKGGEPSLAVAAEKWRSRAETIEMFVAPVPLQLKAAAKSVELWRQLMARDGMPVNRAGLAKALQGEGDAMWRLARSLNGVGSAGAYRQSRDRYGEALGLLGGLKQDGLSVLANNVAEADERLRDGAQRGAISSR